MKAEFLRILLVVAFFCVGGKAGISSPGAGYYMAEMGESCYQRCLGLQLNCNANIQTDNSTELFNELGINCTADTRPWWSEDQPAYVSDPSDSNYGRCLGYVNTPQNVQCGGSFPTTSRLCRCDLPRDLEDFSSFGIGISGGVLPVEEFDVFAWTLAPGSAIGVMSHFWITASQDNLADAVIRYYIDGEETASIAFQPAMATGVGFNDGQSPWGTKWVGKGANNGAYFVNIRIPFHSNIRITWQRPSGAVGGCYIIVRGMPGLPISFQGLNLPMTDTLRLNLITQHVKLNPLQYFDIVDLPAGTSGMHFFSALAVESGNENFLEGCYRYYSPPDQGYPGTLLSTGTEDYFDSAWYFDGGQFHLPVSGYTHFAQLSNSSVTWSAYRFHEMDPLVFNDGFRLVWRNGDAIDPQTNLKCFIETGGDIVGTPTVSDITSYAWVYTW